MKTAPAFVALLLAALLGGCVTAPPMPAPAAPSAADDACTRWFAQLDAAVDAAGVRDAQDERIEGFPGLRIDRFGQATRPPAFDAGLTRSAAFDAWLERAAALDRSAREAEASNLPQAAFPIDGTDDAAAVRERSDRCRAAWPQRLAADANLRSALLTRATVPDRYDIALRALGLYPLVRWPFFMGVQSWQAGHERAMARWASAPPRVQRFVPADGDAPLVFEIETQGDGTLAAFDRFGMPAWRDGAAAPHIDTTQPVVLRRETQALHGARVLRQDVFTLWFPERPASGRLDLLAGALDGVVVRLTYGADGQPLMLDTIHACGCYHLFFPAAHVSLRPDAPQHEEWAFVPARLPALEPGERWVVRIASATHYVVGVGRDSRGAARATGYVLHDENLLRSLPVQGALGGARRSLYGPDGLVAASARGERFVFWPMGIASAGAMRQWGHHATAFVGRRHFDDPNLLAERFELPDTAPP